MYTVPPSNPIYMNCESVVSPTCRWCNKMSSASFVTGRPRKDLAKQTDSYSVSIRLYIRILNGAALESVSKLN